MSDQNIPSSHSLVQRAIDGELISQRADDGYINATALCKAASKQWSHYWANAGTQAFVDELARSLGIPVDLLIQSITTGSNDLRGTWVHPQVSIHLAQWASPEFAVQVSQWVFDWVMKKQFPVAPMTTGEMLIENAKAFRALEIQQLEASRRLDDHDEKFKALGLQEDYHSIKVYAGLNGLRITTQDSKLLGARAKNLSNQKGYTVHSQPDQTYGKVNTYHRDILEIVFRVWSASKS